MKRNLLSILIVVLMLGGTALLLYPTIGEYINSKHSAAVIKKYNDAYVNTADSRLADMISEAEAYNDMLRGAPAALNGGLPLSGYDDILNLTGDGIMGYIDIDKIGVELPIYHGVAKEVLQVGAGHMQGSSLPVGGIGTHCVLSGHRGLPSAKLFTDLDDMEIGDRFTITVLDRVMTYEVDQIKVVLPDNVEYLGIDNDKDYCTLVTCTPYGINTHRLLVRGVRVDGDTNRTPGIFVSNEAFRINKMIVSTVIALPAFIAVVVITMIVERRRTGHGKQE